MFGWNLLPPGNKSVFLLQCSCWVLQLLGSSFKVVLYLHTVILADQKASKDLSEAWSTHLKEYILKGSLFQNLPECSFLMLSFLNIKCNLIKPLHSRNWLWGTEIESQVWHRRFTSPQLLVTNHSALSVTHVVSCLCVPRTVSVLV